jgi:hypothetical protein
LPFLPALLLLLKKNKKVKCTISCIQIFKIGKASIDVTETEKIGLQILTRIGQDISEASPYLNLKSRLSCKTLFKNTSANNAILTLPSRLPLQIRRNTCS